jgi:hypothetical protein
MECQKDVHTEHCCLRHGCKYCDPDCSVTSGEKPQSYDCEDCVSDWNEDREDLLMMKWLFESGKLAGDWRELYEKWLVQKWGI